MATYGNLQDKINLDYLNNMTLVSEVKRAIQTAIRCYEIEPFWFNEAQTAIATTALQSYITVPTDFLTVTRLELSWSAGNYDELQRENFSYIRRLNVTSSTGQPTSFTYWGDRFELAPIPNAVYNGTLYYIKTLPTLSADSDTNVWTNEAANLIAHAATVDLMMNVLQVTDQRKINNHEIAKQRAYYELSSRNDQKAFTRLTPTSF